MKLETDFLVYKVDKSTRRTFYLTQSSLFH